ncbi:unnamed protein product [Pseudo-nitzschia multistriata]|uniref:fructose-bisphosphatase n=1 Tax=Pseudo-nitzschia multistriata TaxID=183589 RepID=A0A448ZTC6_9STRA|nr:unnamed protein product [Pseudo-nitzschia multistriata]
MATSMTQKISSRSSSTPPTRSAANEKPSFQSYLEGELTKDTIDAGLVKILVALAKSCAEVSTRLQTFSLGLEYQNLYLDDDAAEGTAVVETRVNIQGEQQNRMDVISNNIFIENLGSVDAVVAMASEEEDTVILNPRSYGNEERDADRARIDEVHSTGTGYEIAFDPLDGSGNLDVNLPTGSIFGIASLETSPQTTLEKDGTTTTPSFFSRRGSALRAAGYAVYSSSTELVVSLGKDHPDGVLGFTLDFAMYHRTNRAEDAFVLSRKNIRCPPSGPYYSLNEAREPDWPDGLRRWISDAKKPQGTTGDQAQPTSTYSARYVCSLCADFHRTLLQGGWAGNPRPHLRLLYEAAPLAFVMEAAGGRGSDGLRELLEISPEGLHDRVPVFLGSRDTIFDLIETYGDVQQVEAKRYDV